uniref:Ubiquitin-like protease family profile domain-containing protein n=1 Tax=Setaria italica TaxID=4555 RepID=K4AKF3_SETIT
MKKSKKTLLTLSHQMVITLLPMKKNMKLYSTWSHQIDPLSSKARYNAISVLVFTVIVIFMMDMILFATLQGEIETLDDDVVPCGDNTIDTKDIVTHENLETTICVDASDNIATNQEIKAEDDMLKSKDDYSCDEEDESIIKSIGGCREEHVVVRVDDIFVNYKTFKCLLRHVFILRVINAYINLIRAEKYLLCRAESTIYLENTLIVGLLQRDVSSWPIVEQFYQRMQTNGVSCGLFLLNFMEYWTGKKLSDTFMQSDMTNFRLKLAAILCDSTLNTAKELPDGGITDDYTFDTTEFVIENQTQLSQLTCIRYKHIAVAVCDYVLSIKDADALVKEWVRSSDPYPISLSLKNLQDILDVNRSMDIDVFNLAVRMLACDMATVLREPKSHFMDLMFSVVVPYYACGSFGMFAFDKHARMIAIIDPSPVHHNPAYNHLSYYYLPRI